jgi:hypothetical protein
MVYLHPAHPAASWAMPVRAQAPVETTVAIRPAEASLRAHGEGAGEPGALARAVAARRPRPDPEALVGPPPAFEANVLEAERARLAEPGPPAPRGGDGAGASGTGFEVSRAAGGRDDPARLPAGAAYRDARFGAGPARLDLVR